MKISVTTKRQALYVCRIASVLTVLLTMNACGAIRDVLDGNPGSNSSSSGNGTDTGTKASTTNAQSLAASAQQVNDPATQSYVTQCQKNPACKDDADKVSTLIEQAISEIQAQKDASGTLGDFETALTTLIQCVDKNPAANGNTPAAPAQPAQDSNKTCTSQTDPNGTTVTVCSSRQQHCTAKELPNGDVVETCVCGNGNAAGNPNDPNSMPVKDPNATPVKDPNSAPINNPNAVADPNVKDPNSVANPNQPTSAGTTEECTASALPDGSMSVTCTCNVKAGTCKVQTTSP